MSRIEDLYTIQIIYGSDYDVPWKEIDQNRIREIISETEENLTDLLPGSYRARIRRWDDPAGEPTQEDDDE